MKTLLSIQTKSKQLLQASFIVASALLLPLLSTAQTAADSVAIVDKVWVETEIKPGLVWKKAHFEGLFNSNQAVNYLEVDLNHPDRKVSYAGVPVGFKRTSEFVKEAGAAAGINATFFDTRNGGSVTLLKIDGEEINETTLFLASGKRNERASGAILLQQNNAQQQAQIIAGNNDQADWDKQVKADNILVSGPVMILESDYFKLDSNAFNNNRHPRSAVAVLPGNKLILIAVDGRNAQAQGMSIHELAYLLKILGAKQAINLDGGGSSALYVEGAGENGIVNHPSDNQLFDHHGERRVANAIIIF